MPVVSQRLTLTRMDELANFEEYARVSKDRIAALIGTKGKTKAEIEKKCKVKLDIDSKTGEVVLKGKDLFEVHQAENIVKAIARGFSPEKALLLIGEEYFMEVIDLTEFVGKSAKALEQRRARVIGRSGKAREKIEKATGTFISAYGKTVSIIGREDGLPKAKKAVEMLIEGAMHTTVFKWLERSAKAERPMFEI